MPVPLTRATIFNQKLILMPAPAASTAAEHDNSMMASACKPRAKCLKPKESDPARGGSRPPF
jgi:hypothetical protein